MADVDREEPVLQGVVPSLPSPMGSGGVRAAAGGKEVDEVSEVSMEGLQGSLDETPGEPTMLGSIEAIEAALEAQSRSAHLDLGSEDRTVIAPTPIPPESDDRTNPTADAQILEAQPEEAPPMMPLHPAAQTYGMAALAARAQPGPFGARLRKVLGKPVSLSALQLGLLVVASGLFGAVLARGGRTRAPPRYTPQPHSLLGLPRPRSSLCRHRSRHQSPRRRSLRRSKRQRPWAQRKKLTRSWPGLSRPI